MLMNLIVILSGLSIAGFWCGLIWMLDEPDCLAAEIVFFGSTALICILGLFVGIPFY